MYVHDIALKQTSEDETKKGNLYTSQISYVVCLNNDMLFPSSPFPPSHLEHFVLLPLGFRHATTRQEQEELEFKKDFFTTPFLLFSGLFDGTYVRTLVIGM